MSNEIKCMIEAAKKAGKIINKHFGKELVITMKDKPRDILTKADTEAEKCILDILEKEFPSYNIISEEEGSAKRNSEYTFYIDPLDGSNNFIMGIPYFSVSIGLAKKDEMIAAVVYNPGSDQLYYAEKGKGAFLNNKRIYVNKESDIKKAKIAHSCGYHYYANSKDEYNDQLNKLHRNDVYRVMANWSVALDSCLLASGKIEAIITNHNEIHDGITGKLIIKEAGALITDLRGGQEKNDKNTSFVASNGTEIHNHIIKII